MKLLYKKVLDYLLTKKDYFYKNLTLTGGLLDELLEKEIIDDVENADIRGTDKRSRSEKIELLIRMLMVKDDKTYELFKKCLLESHAFVVTKMEKKENKLNKQCEECSEYIQQLLQNGYTCAEADSVVDFEEIQNDIIHNVRGSLRHHDTLLGVLDEHFMIDCIVRAFPKAKKSELCSSRRGKKKKSPRRNVPGYTQTVIKGIMKTVCRQKEDKDVSDSETEDESDLCHEQPNIAKTNFNVDEFPVLVEEILRDHTKEWDQTICQKIRDQRIDSEVYDMMDDNDKKDLIPTTGERIRLNLELNKIKQGERKITWTKNANAGQIKTENLRRFDRPASEHTKYKHGSKFPIKDGRPGNLISPVHKYFMFENKRPQTCENMNSFFDEVINFAAACMNERTNGTFHAGISESGIIIGCDIDVTSVDSTITKAIRRQFKDYQVETVLRCVRCPQFIEVVGNSQTQERINVIEIDVIPHSVIVGNQNFYVHNTNKPNTTRIFYRYRNGEVKKQNASEVEEFIEREKEVAIKQRKEAETHRPKGKKENCYKKFKDFLTWGDDEFEESLYPILMLSHLKNGDKSCYADWGLLKSIPWRAVLDFNEMKDEHGFQAMIEKEPNKVFITHSIEDFNPRKRDDKRLKTTLESITESPFPAWIYCNGTNDDEGNVDARTWMYEKCDSFRKVLDFYKDIIPDSRACILIPLFEKENEVLMQAIFEILLQFGRQCLIMSPSRSIANIYWNELGSRPNALPPDCTVNDCFLIGLPWNQVNECINTIVKSVRRTSGFLIPRANGPPFQVDEKVVAELSDLEIVSVKECNHLESLTIDEKHLEEQNARENYYQGGGIQWANFYFQNQVLHRDVHQKLQEYVVKALAENDDERLAVQKVVVYHQPGSGGTTTSRQVLWDLREDNRCCIVKKITNQTCDQIGRFRELGEEENEETEVKPVLLLLDSNNEEEIAQFVDDLESESYKYSCDLFCVLLICFRVAALPFDRPPKNVMLRQELSPGEHHWFKEKYETLLTKYKQQRGCDPHTLLAFNIMKENFNMESINKSVKEFAGDCMISTKQRTMLKHIAFFNAYDLQFSSIPLSCFDPIMKPPLQWIKHLPPAIRVLTSRIRRQGYGGQNASIRMSNYLLSKPVLNAVLDIEREHGFYQDTIGEVALEVISSNCFKNTFFKHEHKILRNILGDIMKKRDRGSSNKGRLDKFSPLITELLEKKDIDQAVRIVATTYEITDDPLVAQQLARLNADFGNWKDAHTAIDYAITQKPSNSYLIHTKGQLYKEQLQVSFSGCLKDGSEFSISNVNEAIELTNKSMECFRKCQKLSESIDMSQQNPAGYESEILMAIELLKRLDKCKALKPLSALIKGSNKMEMIFPSNRLFLNDLPSTVDTTIEKVERIIHGTNRNSFHSHSRSLYTLDKKQLDKHKQDLTKYFYQDNSNIAVGKTEAPVRVNVFSFLSGIRCPEIEHLLSAIQSMSRQAEDLRKNPLRIFLSMCFSVALKDSQMLLVEPSLLLSLSRRFYETQNTFQSEIAKLESYLYFTTFHWPLNTRTNLKDKLSPFSHWFKALSEWQEMGSKTSTKKCNHKIFFYIGSSGAFPGFVKSENITSTNQLATFHGKVNDNGTETTITLHSFQTPDGPCIKIPFYKRLGRITTYNRKIDVVIGFGLNGPRADWLEKPSSFRKNQRPHSKRSQIRHHSSVITTSHFQGDVSEARSQVRTGNRVQIGAVSKGSSSRISPWTGPQKQQTYTYQSGDNDRRTIENNKASTQNYLLQQVHFPRPIYPSLPMFHPHVRPPLGPITGNERMMYQQSRGYTHDVDTNPGFTSGNTAIPLFSRMQQIRDSGGPPTNFSVSWPTVMSSNAQQSSQPYPNTSPYNMNQAQMMPSMHFQGNVDARAPSTSTLGFEQSPFSYRDTRETEEQRQYSHQRNN